MEERFMLELVVANKYGILNRITGLYSRCGYNINSLNVNETSDPKISRMIIVSNVDTRMQIQLIRRLQKLYDVKEVKLLEEQKV